MNQELYEELLKGRDGALVKLEALSNNLHGLLEALKKPLTVAEATVIIKQVWAEDPTAKNNLLVKLSEADRANNAQLISWEYLPIGSYKALLKELPDVVGVVTVEHEYLLTLIGEGIERLKVAGPYDEAAQDRYDQFRKQVLRYADYCGGCFYMIPAESDVDSWDGLTAESWAVENGDYLFVDDLIEKVKEAHKDMLEGRLMWNRQTTTSLSNIEYTKVHWENAVKLPLWFITYLQNLLTQE